MIVDLTPMSSRVGQSARDLTQRLRFTQSIERDREAFVGAFAPLRMTAR
jgi:hypothetical protein